MTTPDTVHVIEGEGMPRYGTWPAKYGDLVVKFEIQFPHTVDAGQKAGEWNVHMRVLSRRVVSCRDGGMPCVQLVWQPH